MSNLIINHVDEVYIDTTSNSKKFQAVLWFQFKKGDSAFDTNLRPVFQDYLERIGYVVHTFFSSDQLAEWLTKTQPNIDLLMVSSHGSPHVIEELRVFGDTVITNSKWNMIPIFFLNRGFLSDSHAKIFNYLINSLKNEFSLVLDGCLTGNKNFEDNFAKTLSKVVRNANVYAAQSVTTSEPAFVFDEDFHTTGKISNILFQQKDYVLEDAVIYKNGEEKTNLPVGKQYRFAHPRLERLGFFKRSSSGVHLGKYLALIAFALLLYQILPR